MKKIFLGIFTLMILSAGLVFAGTKQTHNFKVSLKNKNILVAYYSLSGNTKYVAERLHEQVGGDIFEITTLKKYPSEKRLLNEIVKYQNENNILPELKENLDISKYDIIFIGTPVWFGTVAQPAKTFLCEHNFKNKIIVPFVTYGGGGGYDIFVEMDDISNGKVYNMPLVVQNKGDNCLDIKIKDWLKSLK